MHASPSSLPNERLLPVKYQPVLTQFRAATLGAAQQSTERVAEWMVALPATSHSKAAARSGAAKPLDAPRARARERACQIDAMALKRVASYYGVALPSQLGAGRTRGPYPELQWLASDYQALVLHIGHNELPARAPGPYQVRLNLQATTDVDSTTIEAYATLRSERVRTWKIPFVFTHQTTQIFGPAGCVPFFAYQLTDTEATNLLPDVAATFAQRGPTFFTRTGAGTFVDAKPSAELEARGLYKTITWFGHSRTTSALSTHRRQASRA